MNLHIGQREVPITVIRTGRRKTATIKIVEGDVHVIVPQHLSQKRIEELIRKKTPWIQQKLHLQASIKPVKPKEYVSGEAFSYLGKNYRLKLIEGDSEGVKLKGGRFLVEVEKSLSGTARTAYVQAQLAQWYQQHAEQLLQGKVERFAPLLGVSPNCIKVKYYKSRWGSCTAEGNITFNWRIIMAPHVIVDYVVVHELAHLKHHDHSSSFWQSVKSVFPEYLELRNWLKVNAPRLTL